MSSGGMSANAFGGYSRLDKFEPQGISASTTPERLIYQATIMDAVHNYLFFGLGKNGTTAEEFAYSCEYLFKARSDNQSTEDLKNMCFDRHYHYAALDNVMAMDRFLSDLKSKRAKIVHDNWKQISEYINSIREKESKNIDPGQQLPLRLYSANEQEILTCPDNLRQVADLLHYSKKKRSRRRNNGNFKNVPDHGNSSIRSVDIGCSTAAQTGDSGEITIQSEIVP